MPMLPWPAQYNESDLNLEPVDLPLAYIHAAESLLVETEQ